MANITDKTAQIRNAVYGKDVRESIASGIEAINTEVESTTNKQELLETEFNQMIINAGSSNAEIVQARVNAEGHTYINLQERMNEVDSQLSEQSTQISDLDNNKVEKTDVGDKTQLNTDDKTSIVNAVNEVKTQATTNQTSIANTSANLATLQSQVTGLVSGSPKPVSLVSQMTDTTKNYVYIGTELGYTSGNWYYWNGSSWTSGGTYQSTGIGDNTITPTKLIDGAKNVRPFIWNVASNSVIKNSNSITISGSSNVGVMHRNVFSYIASGTYNVVATDHYLVIRGWGATTLTDVTRANILDTDIVVAYFGISVWTIWDSIINEHITATNTANIATNTANINNLNIAKVKPFIYTVAGALSKTSTSIIVNNTKVACVFDKGGLFLNAGTYTLTDANNYLVARGIDFTKMYDGASNPRVTPVVVSQGQLVDGDIVLAIKYTDYIWTIWDSIMNEVNINSLNDNINNLLRWYGKKMLNFGDSITYEDKYSPLVSQQIGTLSYINAGIGGTSIAQTDSNKWSNNDQSFCVRASSVDATCDLVTIWGGTNDFGKGVPIGTRIDTTNYTFYGALRNTLDTLILRMPNARFALFTPMQRKHVDDTNNGIDANGKNSAGLYLIDYVNAIKDLAQEYAIPCLDMYSCSGITRKNVDDSTGYLRFTRDGLHPTDEGYSRIAKILGVFLNSI